MGDDEMEQLLADVERELGREWVETVEYLRDQNQLEDVERRYREGGAASAIVGVQDAAERFAAATHDAYVDAGQAAAEWLDAQVPERLITFDATAWRAARWAAQNKLEKVQQITEDQREAIGQVLTRHAGEATNPLEYARELRQSIGLTAYQEARVDSYRTAIATGDFSNALARELRDGRYDRSLAAAIRDGRDIPADQVDRMVEAYRKNWVGYRGEVIARTEGLRVIHQGTEELFGQAIEGGVIDAERLVQQWNSHRDSHTRRSHYVMDGQKRRLGVPFESGDGVLLMYPGDPDAPAAETAQCRCNRSMRLLTVEQARELLAEAA